MARKTLHRMMHVGSHGTFSANIRYEFHELVDFVARATGIADDLGPNAGVIITGASVSVSLFLGAANWYQVLPIVHLVRTSRFDSNPVSPASTATGTTIEEALDALVAGQIGRQDYGVIPLKTLGPTDAGAYSFGQGRKRLKPKTDAAELWTSTFESTPAVFNRLWLSFDFPELSGVAPPDYAWTVGLDLTYKLIELTELDRMLG